MKFSAFFLFYILFIQSIYGFQRDILTHYTTEDGLSQNLVFDLVQDDEGFIWIGTKDGLNRFDGYSFKTYRREASGNGSLSSNYITFLEIDNDGQLWVESQPGGLHLFDSVSDRFIKLNDRPSVPDSFLQAIIFALTGDKENGWWIGTSKGLFYLNTKMDTISQVQIPGIPPNPRIYAIKTTDKADRQIVSVADHGLYELNSKTRQLLPLDRFNRSLSSKNVAHILQSVTDNWLLLEGKTLHTFSDDGDLLQSSKHEPRMAEELFPIDDLIQLHDDRILLLRGRTLYQFHELSGTFSLFLDNKFVNAIMEDDSGILWLGTSGYGIYKSDPKIDRFGLTKKNYYEVLIPDIHQIIEEAAPEQSTVFERQIFGIEQFSEYEFLILTRTTGLYLYNEVNGMIKRFSFEQLYPEEIPRREMLALDLSAEGEIIIYGYAGVIIKTLQSENSIFVPFEKLFPDFTMQSKLPIFEKLTFVKKLDQMIWAGSIEFGLVSYDLITGESKSYRYHPDDSNSLSSDHTLHLSADPVDPYRYVWVGTDGGGVNRIDLFTGNIRRFTESSGLSNNVIYSVYPDTSGYLWMTSNRGIIRMNAENFTTMNFTRTDGLQSNEYNRKEHLNLIDGRFVFCGVFGCNIFNPYEITLNTSTPQMVITDISVRNQSVLPYDSDWFTISDNEYVLDIEWSQNIIGVQFAALEFSGPDKNQYKYRIPPFLNDWTEIGNRREITVTNLDPGFYRLEVLGSNNDGIWSEVPATLGIRIKPPFWMTTLFRTGVILIFAALITSVVWYASRRKYRQKVRELEYKMAIDKERLRISRDMHDDLGARLTQIRLMSEFATADSSYTEKVKRIFQEISQESKGIIEQFSEIVWSLNPKNDTLNNLTDFMVSYTENFCRSIELPCRIDADTSFPEINITSTERHHLLSVLKEALNNAAKYASASEIQFNLSVQDSVFTFTVQDDGMGFNTENHRSTGNGLNNMEKRMNEIGGTVSIRSKIRRGTRIEIIWPLSHTKG